MDEYNLESKIKIVFFWLRCIGLWPKTAYKLDIYTLGVFCLVLMQLWNFFLQAMLLKYEKNYDVLIDQMLVFFGGSLGYFKMYIFIVRNQNVKKLMEMLEKDIFKPKNATQAKLVDQDIALWHTAYKILICGAVGTCGLYMTAPIFNGIFAKRGFPVKIWCPFDCKKTVNYFVTYLLEYVFVMILGLGFNVDLLIFLFIIHIGSQCEILSDDLRNLSKNKKHFASELLACIKHHKEIVRLSSKCTNFCNVMLLAQFLTIAIIMSLYMYLAIINPPDNVQFYIRLIGVVTYIGQIFIYCWLGDRVETKSLNILSAAFESCWIEQPESTKKTLLIFMDRIQYPIKISTFNLFYFSLDTFVRIMRSVYSIFMIIQQLND